MRKVLGRHILSIFSFKLFCPLHSLNNMRSGNKNWNHKNRSLNVCTAPLETMGPFAAILPRSNHGFDLQFHLGKTASNRIKNLGFTQVISCWLKPRWKAGDGWVWIGYRWFCFKVTIGELLSLGVIKFTRKYLKELCIGGFIAPKVNKNHSFSIYCTEWLTKNCGIKKNFQYNVTRNHILNEIVHSGLIGIKIYFCFQMPQASTQFSALRWRK